jgi:hypothetical protein
MKTVTMEQVKQAGVVLKRVNEEKLRLEKEAAVHGLEKRAMRIAFREVELGISQPFNSYEDLMEKVAGLMKEDLNVVEKALERGYGNAGSIGTLVEGAEVGEKDVFKNWVLNGTI